MRRLTDIATALFFIAAAFLIAQPSSLIRASWARYSNNRRVVQLATQHWSEIDHIGSRLFNSREKVELVVVSDYECPFCRASQAAIDSAVRRGVRISLLHYPGPTHPSADGAARAALCAESVRQLPRLHAHFMQTNAWQKSQDWLREATSAGVTDLDNFGACVTGAEVRKRLSSQTALADSLMVRGTPTFVSPRGVHGGVASLAEILDLVGRH
ncbi:MAG: DsbA family protein [Gemmatimonadaceae bacterium]|nr:DsbA family protein [Gemmatimonadaceae bacterium]